MHWTPCVRPSPHPPGRHYHSLRRHARSLEEFSTYCSSALCRGESACLQLTMFKTQQQRTPPPLPCLTCCAAHEQQALWGAISGSSVKVRRARLAALSPSVASPSPSVWVCQRF